MEDSGNTDRFSISAIFFRKKVVEKSRGYVYNRKATVKSGDITQIG